MVNTRFEPSSIKNKFKREEVAGKHRKAKNQEKLKKRLERAKVEADDPAAKKKRLEENVPRTLDNMREFDPSTLPVASTSTTTEGFDEHSLDLASDPFSSYFTQTDETDPLTPPKILITTSPKATKATFAFCDEIAAVFPGAEFIRRKKGKGFEMGRIAGWAGGRGYKHLVVVNEDTKKPNAITLVCLPNGPTAYFKLTSIELTDRIFGHARATAHNPELILNGFVTRLGHAVGRMFQTCFPPLPEFQGRQVVTLHNQRDFIFFRRHRYAFRSTEKVALQEIGPRFTLKLRSLKRGIPSVKAFGEAPEPLTIDLDDDVQNDQPSAEVGNDDEQKEGEDKAKGESERTKKASGPPKQDDILWQWKPELEVNRRTFFL